MSILVVFMYTYVSNMINNVCVCVCVQRVWLYFVHVLLMKETSPTESQSSRVVFESLKFPN